MNGPLSCLVRLLLGRRNGTRQAQQDTPRTATRKARRPAVPIPRSERCIPPEAEWQPVEFCDQPSTPNHLRMNMAGRLARRVYCSDARVGAAIEVHEFLQMFGTPYKQTNHLHTRV